MKQYDVVKIKEIIRAPQFEADSFNQRPPEVGDIATIIEIYRKPSLDYELECSDDNGITLWMQTFGPEDIVMEKV